jgi:hypothetical protein
VVGEIASKAESSGYCRNQSAAGQNTLSQLTRRKPAFNWSTIANADNWFLGRFTWRYFQPLGGKTGILDIGWIDFRYTQFNSKSWKYSLHSALTDIRHISAYALAKEGHR